MIRALLDTNVLFSAIDKPNGIPGKILLSALRHHFELHISDSILAELRDVAKRPGPEKRLAKWYSPSQLQRLFWLIENASEVIKIQDVPPTLIDPIDAKDRHVIDAALFAQVDYLVTGDKKHILALKNHPKIREHGVQIVSPTDFLNKLKKL